VSAENHREERKQTTDGGCKTKEDVKTGGYHYKLNFVRDC
jgi:hypothetical protein